MPTDAIRFKLSDQKENRAGSFGEVYLGKIFINVIKFVFKLHHTLAREYAITERSCC